MKKITEKLLEIIKTCEGKYQKKSEDKIYCPLIQVTSNNFNKKICQYQSALVDIITEINKNVIKYKCNYEKKS